MAIEAFQAVLDALRLLKKVDQIWPIFHVECIKVNILEKGILPLLQKGQERFIKIRVDVRSGLVHIRSFLCLLQALGDLLQIKYIRHALLLSGWAQLGNTERVFVHMSKKVVLLLIGEVVAFIPQIVEDRCTSNVA